MRLLRAWVFMYLYVLFTHVCNSSHLFVFNRSSFVLFNRLRLSIRSISYLLISYLCSYSFKFAIYLFIYLFSVRSFFHLFIYFPSPVQEE